MKTWDANDFLYQFNSSRNYDPSGSLEKITVPVMAINSADDFINPPELDIMPKEIKRLPKGKFVLLPISEATRGHGTHTLRLFGRSILPNCSMNRNMVERVRSRLNMYLSSVSPQFPKPSTS